MFVNEIITPPRIIDGRRFVERTISSKFENTNITITTVFLDGKPLTKHYLFDTPTIVKTFWKNLAKQSNVTGWTLQKNLDIIV
jgi:hypothetical protein